MNVNFFIKGNKIVYIIIVLSFFTSILLSNHFIKKFDNYEISTDKLESHAMIKSDLSDYWSNAKVFKDDLKNKNFISSGNEMWRSYLHERLIGFYFYIIDILNYLLFQPLWMKMILIIEHFLKVF